MKLYWGISDTVSLIRYQWLTVAYSGAAAPISLFLNRSASIKYLVLKRVAVNFQICLYTVYEVPEQKVSFLIILDQN
jgi:hypothetical protein